jgi:hypothetical protein
VEELHTILWAYRTTPHLNTGESLFRLTYGTEAVNPIVLNELNYQIGTNTTFRANTENLREELKFVDKIINEAALKELVLRQKIDAQHNKRVIK